MPAPKALTPRPVVSAPAVTTALERERPQNSRGPEGPALPASNAALSAALALPEGPGALPLSGPLRRASLAQDRV
ncbi:hypothetical protein ACFVIM_28295, partial [Streptomyces sp. NPDC057638]